MSPQVEPRQEHEPANTMHKFKQFPAELRLKIWEMAMAEMRVLRRKHGSIQRFRFDLVYDANRVKPGRDKSRGWVACFTPLRINTDPSFVLLRTCFESRAAMIHLHKLSILTVHELPVDSDGHSMAPRKCHMPFSFIKDDFCVEGITHALDRAETMKDNKDAVWNPYRLPLADLLENALGLRFAWRIKRLTIIPHPIDIRSGRQYRESARNMDALSKRFPALVTVKAAIPCPQRALGFRSFPSTSCLLWKAASLRGRRQGGPTGMSEEDREAVYRTAWRRIFDSRAYELFVMTDDLFDGGVCVVGNLPDLRP